MSEGRRASDRLGAQALGEIVAANEHVRFLRGVALKAVAVLALTSSVACGVLVWALVRSEEQNGQVRSALAGDRSALATAAQANATAVSSKQLANAIQQSRIVSFVRQCQQANAQQAALRRFAQSIPARERPRLSPAERRRELNGFVAVIAPAHRDCKAWAHQQAARR